MAVRMETGSSAAVAQRATVSIASMNMAPRPMLAGMTRVLSFPNIILDICGIRSPTQPMSPHMETTEAVIMVEPRTISALSLFTGTPRAVASSSERLMAFKRQRSMYIMSIPEIIKGAPIKSASEVMPDRLPMSQKVIAGSTSWGSAVYFTNDTRAEKRVLSRTICISEIPYFSAVRTNIPAVPHIEAPRNIIKK